VGLSSNKFRNPVKSDALCGASFVLAALVPMFPFVLSLSSSKSLIVSIFTGVITKFGVGCMKTIFIEKEMA